MGEGHAGGDTLRLVVEYEGDLVALLLWGSAAYRLKDRDAYIGWNKPQWTQRQKLVVQNWRFTLLVDRGAHPNLPSRILGQTYLMALRYSLCRNTTSGECEQPTWSSNRIAK